MKDSERRQRQQWMQQWEYAARCLPELKHKELRELSPEQLLARIDAVLSLAGEPGYLSPERRTTSGLVAQQAWLQKLKKR